MEVVPGPPAWLEWEGIRWYRNRSGYYQNRAGVLMHTVVWERANGQRVPQGKLIHHRDRDRANNQPENLELMSVREHMAEHGILGRSPSPEVRQAISHAQRESWAQRKPRERTCAHCGGTFRSKGQRAKFCAPTCRHAFAREQHRASGPR